MMTGKYSSWSRQTQWTSTLAAVALVIAAGCAGSGSGVATRPADPPLLTGWVARDTVMHNDGGRYQAVYDTVTLQEPFLELLAHVSADADVVVVFGTWCGDSRRGVPPFVKIADRIGIPPDRLRFYGVDRSKKGPGTEADEMRIERVPTMIVRRGGIEIGRIVETPKVSWEGDLLTILAGAPPR